jgi:hypothetical protein
MKNIEEFKKTFNEIQTINQRIKRLEEEREKHFQTLDEFISQWLIAYNWKPYYNEKAVHITLDGEVAWHLWFLEIDGDDFRFREVPNDFPHIRNYHRQEVLPPEQNYSHSWIVPMALFQELNTFLSFTVYRDKHETFMR